MLSKNCEQWHTLERAHFDQQLNDPDLVQSIQINRKSSTSSRSEVATKRGTIAAGERSCWAIDAD